MSRGTGFAGPQAGGPLGGGRELHAVSDRGAVFHQPGPRDWLRQTAGAAAPSGGRELHAVSDRGGHIAVKIGDV